MLARIVEFALAQRLLVCLLTVLLCAGGAYALQQLPIDAFPDVSPVQVKVIMKAPGMTPEEVEARITAPIELEMIGIPYKKFLRSVTKYALTDVTIEFEDNVDIYWARNQVTERLTAITKDLPAGVTGGLAPITTPLGEMFMFTVEGGTLTLEQRRTLLDWTIRPALRTLPGVADVNSLGGVVRSFEVIPDNAALVAHGVTIDALRKAVEANNRNDGAGRLRDGEEVLLVRSEGNIRNLDDLKAIVVASRDGKIVRVGDVARVEFGTVTRYGVVTKDGQGEAVQGLVLGLRGANARIVVEGVKKKLAELQPSLPAGVTIKPFYDRGELVQRSVSTISTALLEATALVVVLLVLFLGDWRAALVVVATLPLAALSTFILMRVFGMSANLMSLGGLAIAIGMLIDAAVVVVENVVSEVNRSHASRHVPLLNIIFRGTREVAVPVTSGITIIVIVFLPLLTLQGLEGKLFIPVALAIVFALSSSLILSLTVIPVLSSFLLKRESHADTWLTRRAIATYVPALRWSLRHEKLVFTLALGVLAGAGVVYTLSGKTFMPTMDEGSIIVGIEKIPSVSIEETAAVDLKIHKAIMAAIPEVTGIVARAGADELGLDPMGLNQTDTYLLTKPPSEWRKPNDKEWLEGELRKVLDKLPGISYSFTQPIDMRVQEMIIGVRGDVVVKIFGPDIPTLNKLAVEITQKLETVPGNEDVRTVLNDGVQYLSVAVDRLQAGALGLNVDDIADGLRAQIEGVPLGIVLEEGRRTPVLLRGSESVRGSSATFTDLRVTLPDGGNVPLNSLARLDRIDGPVKIDRENGRRLALVQSDVKGRDLVGFVDEAKKIVSEQVKLPRGYELAWGGQFENQQRAAARLEIVVPIALALIFLLL
ncbi:MAG: CusA/CzcA family heavy metal efflux RND transporter, partial [Reyranella sp.]|nr:CusA/CzcA family heavy metal efflux RND transporter [Reyranella sp.]